MSNSITRRGILTGTPVPLSSREQNSDGAGALMVEHWTPDQMETYLSKYKKTDKKEASKTMEITITKEEYLSMRKGGMGRTEVCRHLGISAPAFYGLLFQWGIKDKAVEEQVLEAMPVVHAEILVTLKNEPNTSSQQNTQAHVDNSERSDDMCLTVRIPVAQVEWPEEMQSSAFANIDRDSLIRLGIACLQNAAVWAHRDLVDILGDQSATVEPLQAFMERKCAGGVSA